MRRVVLFAMLFGLQIGKLHADIPSFEDFFQGVSDCSIDMERYHPLLMASAHAEGVLIALPSGRAPRGVLVSAFYYSPGRGGGGDQYGLLFNAPLEAVAQVFPEFAGRHTVNGHLRRLLRLSEETGNAGARRRTLLVCTGGVPI